MEQIIKDRINAERLGQIKNEAPYKTPQPARTKLNDDVDV